MIQSPRTGAQKHLQFSSGRTDSSLGATPTEITQTSRAKGSRGVGHCHQYQDDQTGFESGTDELASVSTGGRSETRCPRVQAQASSTRSNQAVGRPRRVGLVLRRMKRDFA